jgi:hypothetical protein
MFEGFTAGRKWNGWATPYFTKAEADKIVKWWNGGLSAEDRRVNPAFYDAEAMSYVFPLFDSDEMPDEFYGNGHGVYGEQLPEVLYPIGTGCWTWDEWSLEPYWRVRIVNTESGNVDFQVVHAPTEKLALARAIERTHLNFVAALVEFTVEDVDGRSPRYSKTEGAFENE